MKATKLLAGLICLLLFTTCTIIEDGDITDPGQVLTLTAISISQAGQEGTNTHANATVTTSGSGGLIQKIDWQLPPIPNNDTNIHTFRFRTERFATTENLQSTAFRTFVDSDLENQIETFFEGYDAGGRVGTIRNVGQSDNQEFERYEFQYDSEGRVTNVTTTYTSDITIVLQDVITYDFDSKIDIIRRTVNVDGAMSQAVFYIGFGRQPGNTSLFTGTDDDIGGFVIREFAAGAAVDAKNDVLIAGSEPENHYAYFQNDPGNWFGGDNDNNASPLPFQGNVDMLINDAGSSLASIQITDIRFFGNGEFQNENFSPFARNRYPDYYYFHPFFLFPNLFEDGRLLQQIYFSDWWIVNQGSDLAYEFEQNRDMTVEYSLAN